MVAEFKQAQLNAYFAIFEQAMINGYFLHAQDIIIQKKGIADVY